MSKAITRDEIIKVITDTLEPLNFVNAMWQCGAAAFNRVDKWSDVDIVIDVEDDRVMDVFSYTDQALQGLSPIEYTYGTPHPMSEGAYQKVYRLEGTSEFLVIEICVVRNSAKQKFFGKEIHGNTPVSFDKKGVTEKSYLDKNKFEIMLNKRVQDLKLKFNLYQFLVTKELNRENYIEALEFYRNFTLTPLTEALRLKYTPYRYDFRYRYIQYDLPQEIVTKIFGFYYIKDGFELYRKHKLAAQWFNEVIEELEANPIKLS